MLCSAFLRIERVIGRAAQSAICGPHKVCSRKDSYTLGACPLWCSIDESLRGLLSLSRLWLCFCLSKLSDTHRGRVQTMTQFQAYVPHPLSHDLPELLPAGRVRAPAVRVQFLV